MRLAGLFGVAWVATLLMTAHGSAASIDLHAYWDDRCQSCHGDAGPFARRTLALRDGRLVGRHHVDDLETFLRGHVLADDLVAPVTAMLAGQVATPPLYADHCRSCHGSAAAFVRASLLERDGVLAVRGSGRPVADVLRRHGGLAPADQAIVVQTLARVRREVGG